MNNIYSFLNNLWTENLEENKQNKAFIPFILLLVTLPISMAINNVLLVVFLLATLFSLKIKENYKLIPKIGVYIVKSILQEKTVFGIMNIGLNPTVNGEDLSIEVHFIDFNADLYNTQISVSVIARIRDEEKFTSIDLLKTQIQKDKNYAISFIEKIV